MKGTRPPPVIQADIPVATVVSTTTTTTPTPGVVESATPLVSGGYYGQQQQQQSISEAEKMAWLRANVGDAPEGILEEFRKSASAFAVRYFIIDNSGSMQLTDGHRIVPSTKTGKPTMVASSRWDELCDSLAFHSAVAAHLYAPTEFRLLNEPAGVPAVVPVGFGDPDRELRQMKALTSTSPLGRTPLCQRIREVIAAVRQREHELRSLGKRALVLIASDGEPSDGDVAEALRPLASLPVFVVLRLCTEEDRVVEFWNQVDADLELDLEVLDDPVSEAREVANHNPFLAYGIPLHRLREWGCTNKIFDTIDESKLAAPQIIDLVRLVYGSEDQAVQKLPHPQVHWRAFVHALEQIQHHDRNKGYVFDPLKRRQAHWINTHALSRHYGHACAIQ
mmetsp:Transcript_26198/g.84792  ORF Transcript_26198/g.84792 Transcript_26198/m.84792 type:complete len:393 (-) Transcript_26198:566-1744(-)